MTWDGQKFESLNLSTFTCLSLGDKNWEIKQTLLCLTELDKLAV